MRDVTANFLAIMQGFRIYRPRIFGRLDFSDQPVRFWTGVGDFPWDGQVWKGLGTLGTAARFEERGGVEVETLQLVLKGVQLETKQLAIEPTLYQQRDGDLWLAEMTADETFAEFPQPMFSGLMDYMVQPESADSAEIRLNIVSEMILLNLARTYYYTPEDQRALTGDENDTFLDEIPKNTEEIVW